MSNKIYDHLSFNIFMVGSLSANTEFSRYVCLAFCTLHLLPILLDLYKTIRTKNNER